MKKTLILIAIVILSTQICIAEEVNSIEQAPQANEESIEEINSYFVDEQEQPTELHGYLDYSENIEPDEANAVILNTVGTTGINITQPKSFNSQSFMSDLRKPSFQPIQEDYRAASKFSSQEYTIRPVSGSYSKKVGKFTLGTTYDSFLNSAQVNYSTGFFAKYDSKYLALSAAFAKSTNYNYDSYNDKIYIAPELKLTKRLSLLDVMQTDVDQINKKNELVLRYTPNLKKYADDVQFEVGAGQSFYQDNYINSSLRFSTRFKL